MRQGSLQALHWGVATDSCTFNYWKQTRVALAHAQQNLSPTQDVAQM